MINLEKAKKEFIKYTEKYDSKNSNISRKIGHTFRVENNCKIIAKSINMTEEQVEIAKLIGLLHDIGRFEQYKKYQNFSDIKSVDLAKLGVEILKENSYIRNYIETITYDSIILKAIKNHNKLKIEEGLNKEELIFSKIIRDADKIDILFEEIEIFSKFQYSKVVNEIISEEVFNEAKRQKTINNKYINTNLDKVVQRILYVYDLNFKKAFEILEEKKYINKIIDFYNYNEKSKIQIEEIRSLVNMYIANKVRGIRK